MVAQQGDKHSLGLECMLTPVLCLNGFAEEQSAIENAVAGKSDPVVNCIVKGQAYHALAVPVTDELRVPAHHPAAKTCPPQNAGQACPPICKAKQV